MSLFLEEMAPHWQKTNEKNVEVGKPVYADKREAVRILRPFFERHGIIGLNPISIEELHKSMERNGIRAEEKEFSQAIIEERGK